MTIRFTNEKKLNAWTHPLMLSLFEQLKVAAESPEVRGVVVTGAGSYYSAGVDLSATIQPMMPSTLIRSLRDQNQYIFSVILNFPKPLVAAVNGPAIGAAVTTSILMDAVVASENATFSLPFAKLGLVPEGCSSHTFPERIGAERAERMLGAENWTPTGTEALESGLIDEVVAGGNDEVHARAVAIVRERIAAGGTRRYGAEEHALLSRVNAEESANLANAFVSPPFLRAMRAFNTKRKKPSIARFFALLETTLPLWRPADIAPNYDFDGTPPVLPDRK